MRYASRRVVQRSAVDDRGARAVVALSLLCAVTLAAGCTTATRGRPSVPESQPPLAAVRRASRSGPAAAGEAPAGEDEAPLTASPAQAASDTGVPSTDIASTTRAQATTTSTPAAVEAPPLRRRAPGGCKVLILGDSKIATDLGAALQAELARRPELVVARRGKSATGLSRPDFFDWWGRGRAAAGPARARRGHRGAGWQRWPGAGAARR
jgi:hypothetical protein